MPSIVVDYNNSRTEGMVLLGNSFNKFFNQREPAPPYKPLYKPVEVLDMTFREILSLGAKVFHLYNNAPNLLQYKGITGGGAGGRIKFHYEADEHLFPDQRRKVKIEPREDNFDPAEPTAFVMLAAFSNKRTDLLQNYLADTVDDIVGLASDLDAARAYTLAALTFSRCK